VVVEIKVIFHGNIAKYKVRLVAYGFAQRYGIEFHITLGLILSFVAFQHC